MPNNNHNHVDWNGKILVQCTKLGENWRIFGVIKKKLSCLTTTTTMQIGMDKNTCAKLGKKKKKLKVFLIGYLWMGGLDISDPN